MLELLMPRPKKRTNKIKKIDELLIQNKAQLRRRRNEMATKLVAGSLTFAETASSRPRFALVLIGIKI